MLFIRRLYGYTVGVLLGRIARLDSGLWWQSFTTGQRISVHAAPQSHSVWAWRSRLTAWMTDEWTGWMEWTVASASNDPTGAWPDYRGPLSLILVIATHREALSRPHPRWNPVASTSVPRWGNEGRRGRWVAPLSLTGVDGCQITAINQKRQMWRMNESFIGWRGSIVGGRHGDPGTATSMRINATGDKTRSPEQQ